MTPLNLLPRGLLAKVAITLVGIFALSPDFVSADRPSPESLIAAFAAAHDGYSSDEVLIRDELRNDLLRRLAPNDADPENPLPGDAESFERDVMLMLLQLRKAGKLTINATRRGKSVPPEVYPVAEIAARVVTDRHRVTTDTVLADPRLRAELQSEAEKITAAADPYAIRKAVLGLRKRRALKPELVLKVADWDRQIETYSLSQLTQRLQENSISKGPGVYLFRSSEGYLYIGEAKNLASRLTTHLESSDRISLADYIAGDQAHTLSVELHRFPQQSAANRVVVRRAYESELIRSRQPKFNVRP